MTDDERMHARRNAEIVKGSRVLVSFNYQGAEFVDEPATVMAATSTEVEVLLDSEDYSRIFRRAYSGLRLLKSAIDRLGEIVA